MSETSLVDVLLALVPWLGLALVLWIQGRWR